MSENGNRVGQPMDRRDLCIEGGHLMRSTGAVMRRSQGWLSDEPKGRIAGALAPKGRLSQPPGRSSLPRSGAAWEPHSRWSRHPSNATACSMQSVPSRMQSGLQAIQAPSRPLTLARVRKCHTCCGCLVGSPSWSGGGGTGLESVLTWIMSRKVGCDDAFLAVVLVAFLTGAIVVVL